MKQTLILALFSFVVAIVGSTWFVTKVMPPRDTALAIRAGDTGSAKPPAAPRKVTRSDSGAKAKGVKADSSQADSSSGKPGARGVDAKAPAKPVDKAAAEAEATLRAKNVAKILAQMKPKEAVGIMAKLTDDEVDRILRQLNAKQVAALLAVLPGERAASMSRRLLDPRPGREGGN